MSDTVSETKATVYIIPTILPTSKLSIKGFKSCYSGGLSIEPSVSGEEYWQLVERCRHIVESSVAKLSSEKTFFRKQKQAATATSTVAQNEVLSLRGLYHGIAAKSISLSQSQRMPRLMLPEKIREELGDRDLKLTADEIKTLESLNGSVLRRNTNSGTMFIEYKTPPSADVEDLITFAFKRFQRQLARERAVHIHGEDGNSKNDLTADVRYQMAQRVADQDSLMKYVIIDSESFTGNSFEVEILSDDEVFDPDPQGRAEREEEGQTSAAHDEQDPFGDEFEDDTL